MTAAEPVTVTLRLYGGGTETITVPARGTEKAFTCPGCGTAHLLMVSAAPQDTQPDA